MPVYTALDVSLREQELSTSLALTKFAWIKTKEEEERAKRSKDNSFARRIVERVCNGKQLPSRKFHLPNARTTQTKLQSRLIVNQAGGVLENAGICLHRHFGFPYIPGSAVKGAARHYAWEQWNFTEDPTAKLESALKLALTFGFPTGDSKYKDKDTRQLARPELGFLDEYLRLERPDLFGESGKLKTFAGSVAFLPAQPVGRAKLVTDIVNCHHKNYYAGKQEVATDDEDPNPQFFPAVEAGTVFEFVIAPVGRDVNWAIDLAELADFRPVDFAMKCLERAIDENGIGAKTCSGYGWFTEDEEERKKRERTEKRRREQEERDRLAAEKVARQKAEQDKKLAQYKAAQEKIREQEEQARAAKLESALEMGLESVRGLRKFGDVVGKVNTLLQAKTDGFTDEEKKELAKILSANFAEASKKDRKKWLKDIVKRATPWIGLEAARSLEAELRSM